MRVGVRKKKRKIIHFTFIETAIVRRVFESFFSARY